MVNLTGQELIDCSTNDLYEASKTPDDSHRDYQRPRVKSRITQVGTFLASGDANGFWLSHKPGEVNDDANKAMLMWALPTGQVT